MKLPLSVSKNVKTFSAAKLWEHFPNELRNRPPRKIHIVDDYVEEVHAATDHQPSEEPMNHDFTEILGAEGATAHHASFQGDAPLEVTATKVSAPTYKRVLTVREVADAQNHKFIKVKTRLLVTALLTNPEYAGMSSVKGLQSVKIDEGDAPGQFNFLNPFRQRTEKADGGFLREPLAALFTQVAELNSAKVLCGDDAADGADTDLTAHAMRVINLCNHLALRGLRADYPVAYIGDEAPDGSDEYDISEETAEPEVFTVNDFVQPSYWCGKSSAGGIDVLNVNMNLAFHAFSFYDNENKLKLFKAVRKFLFDALAKTEATNVDVALAAVIDNAMLKFADIRALLNDVFASTDDIEFKLLTADDLRARIKLREMGGQPDAEWPELDVLLPYDEEDVSLLVRDSEFLLLTRVSGLS